MSRRSHDPPSSLELFLDTICNTFGGIMFLAILLSVLVQNRVKNPIETSSEMHVSPEQAHSLAMRAEQLRDKCAQLGDLIRELGELQPRPEDSDLDELSSELQKNRKLLADELRKQGTLANQLNEQLARNSAIAEAQSEIERNAREATKSLIDEQRRLQEQINKRIEVLQLPRVETANKRVVILLMKYKRVYRLFAYGNNPDSDQLKVLRDTTKELKVEPKRDAGWNLSDAAQKEELRSFLAEYPSTSFAIRAFVWPDSFDSFAELKAIFLRDQFQYELDPYSSGDSITFVQGSHMPMVQ